MSENLGEFERLLGHAALRLWSELPREVQENLFETAVPLDPVIRNGWRFFFTTVIQGRLIRLSQPSWHSCSGRWQTPRSPLSPRAAYGMGGCF